MTIKTIMLAVQYIQNSSLAMGWVYITLSMGVMFPNLTAT